MAFSSESPSDHRIRLRGPWHAVWLGALPDDRSEVRINLPGSRQELFGDRAGIVRLVRRFGQPSGIEEGERVWLEVATRSEASVLLNGEWLGTTPAGSVRFDVTNQLGWRNRLDLDLKLDEPDGSSESLIEVALVIEEIWD